MTPSFQSGGGGGEWPDAFMSYPLSSPIVLDNVHGSPGSPYVIEEKSFQNLAYPQRPITLSNCSYITVRRIDSRRCSMGVLYAINCNNLVIDHCRAENITGPNERPGGENRANMYQLNDCTVFDCSWFKVRYGDNEDWFSHFNSDTGTLSNFEIEGAITTNQPTSDGGPSIPWRSTSGTGAIMGDGGGFGVTVSDGSMIEPGQVGIAIAGGYDCTFDNVVVIGTSNTAEGELNTAGYVWDQYPEEPGCYGHAVTNCRTWFANGGHFWDGATCGAINFSGSVFGDGTLDVNDFRVVL